MLPFFIMLERMDIAMELEKLKMDHLLGMSNMKRKCYLYKYFCKLTYDK